MHTTRFLFVSGLVAAAAGTAYPARAQRSPCIRVPDGIRHGAITTQSSSQDGMKYIVVGSIIVVSPLRNTGAWRIDDFSLIVGDKRYHPSARPGLGAIDISQGGVVGPRDVIKGNLAFLVPSGVDAGSVEFRPYDWKTRDKEAR